MGQETIEWGRGAPIEWGRGPSNETGLRQEPVYVMWQWIVEWGRAPSNGAGAHRMGQEAVE